MGCGTRAAFRCCPYSPWDLSAHSELQYPTCPKTKGICERLGDGECPRKCPYELTPSVTQFIFSLSFLFPDLFFPHHPPAVLTVPTHTPHPRILIDKMPCWTWALPTCPSPPRLLLLWPQVLPWAGWHAKPGTTWERGTCCLRWTPGLKGHGCQSWEGAVAFAAWDDDEPWGPWLGNGTFWLPAVALLPGGYLSGYWFRHTCKGRSPWSLLYRVSEAMGFSWVGLRSFRTQVSKDGRIVEKRVVVNMGR